MERATMARALAPEGFSWSQLEPGQLHADQEVADLGAVQVVRLSFSLGLRAEGELPSGKRLIGTLGDSRMTARWFGVEGNGEHVATSRRAVDLCTHEASTFYYATIDERPLDNLSSGVCDAIASIDASSNGSLTHDRALARRLRVGMKTILEAYKRTAQGAPVSLRTKVDRLFTPLLALSLERGDTATAVPRSLTRRIAAVRACEAYVREHVESNPTLSDLTIVSGLRLRSLINAFQAVTGLSPMAYLKKTRLGNVRRMLQHADKERTRIIDVAANLGFWHMGHFTADYRAMFGETPSDTLRRG
jgi:AraC-like DNA-binding protein